MWIAQGGAVGEVTRGAAIGRLSETPHVLLNAPLVGQRLGTPDVSGLDLLELFAFVYPARFVVPTVKGLARAVGIEPPASDADAAPVLIAIAEALLARLEGEWPEREGAWTSNATLYRLGWGWAPFVAQRLKQPERGERMLFSRLSQWEEAAERAPPRTLTIPAEDAQERLASLTGAGAEPRPGQVAMAGAAAAVFAPRKAAGEPNMLLAEAGTGIGKTLAYLAPASLWAERAQGTVWVSTYTKALQRQLDAESARIVADPEERKRRIVIRKGREN